MCGQHLKPVGRRNGIRLRKAGIIIGKLLRIIPSMNTRLLFVDDEENVRTLLPMILRKEGFDVTVVATVPEALDFINRQKFEVLLADLNIGQAGDGFTVVSAMRRTQPEVATFILTGYPDFQSALEAAFDNRLTIT